MRERRPYSHSSVPLTSKRIEKRERLFSPHIFWLEADAAIIIITVSDGDISRVRMKREQEITGRREVEVKQKEITRMKKDCK